MVIFINNIAVLSSLVRDNKYLHFIGRRSRADCRTKFFDKTNRLKIIYL